MVSVSLSILLIFYIIVYFAISVFVIFSATSFSARLILITSWRLGSLFGFLVLVARERVIPNPTASPLAATDAYDYVDRGDAERVSSCVRRV